MTCNFFEQAPVILITRGCKFDICQSYVLMPFYLTPLFLPSVRDVMSYVEILILLTSTGSPITKSSTNETAHGANKLCFASSRV